MKIKHKIWMLSTGSNSPYKITVLRILLFHLQEHLFLNEILQTVHETCSKQYRLQIEWIKSVRHEFLHNKNVDIV